MNKDRLLIDRIIKGDKNSFNDLVESYKRLVAHIVYTNVKNQNDRDDLCQEIFLKIYLNLSTFKFKCKLSTWIGKIAYNSCINYSNKKKLLINVNIECIRDIDGTTDDLKKIKSEDNNLDPYLRNIEIRKIINNKIQELPVKYQTVLTLFHIDELSYKEISEILNLHIDNIKVILSRARKMLKDKILEEYRKEDIWF
jgi:RNA polymerase sigma factor (sigma-70 family)